MKITQLKPDEKTDQRLKIIGITLVILGIVAIFLISYGSGAMLIMLGGIIIMFKPVIIHLN